MLLAIDIGNTTIATGVYKGKKGMGIFKIETTIPATLLRTKCKKEFSKLSRRYPLIEKIVICSVVPQVLKEVESIAKNVFHKKILIVGRDIKVPIKNLYNARQIGQDRLVCAFAAIKLYGKPAVIVDLGTAITLDVVSPKGEYEGGIIVPGIRLSAESLFRKTALLPKIDIHKPCALIGKNTEESILSGIFYGYGALICGLISQIARKIKGRPKVIVTGGYADIMKKYIDKKIDIIDEQLVFRGLLLLLRE